MREGIFRPGAWPVWSVSRPGGGRATWVRGLLALALFLAWPVWSAVKAATRPHAGPLPAAAVAVLLLYGASWIAVMAYGATRRPRERVLLVGWLFALGVCLALLRHGAPAFGLLAYALSAAVWLLPAVWALALAAATAAARLAVLWATAGAVRWSDAVAIFPELVTPVGVVLLVRLVVQLGQAREEIETLAAAAERARLARDLHDVLGHTLTAITVKTGLTRRLLESGAGPQDALAELRDVERLSREAHAEIRATISGHRRPSLAVELVGARAALRAAGIAAALPSSAGQVSPDLDEPFSYVLREAVTNVIRHSGATRCEVRVGGSSLEVSDDGGSPARFSGPGNGLAGLAERLRPVGARLEAGPLPGGGYRLSASRP
ncbi:sensor histidine kinase [Microbispora sp. ATCC PTA-5024]|uniref:sensor histidine kinase n=1 Tax=Microbispora sp. ATCC PTA-5024 TaxID=316330 RepID=UPI0012EDBD4B|nr:histidine kinase [Microbispora sp. ATCC PTA-5024]